MPFYSHEREQLLRAWREHWYHRYLPPSPQVSTRITDVLYSPNLGSLCAVQALQTASVKRVSVKYRCPMASQSRWDRELTRLRKQGKSCGRYERTHFQPYACLISNFKWLINEPRWNNHQSLCIQSAQQAEILSLVSCHSNRNKIFLGLDILSGGLGN